MTSQSRFDEIPDDKITYFCINTTIFEMKEACTGFMLINFLKVEEINNQKANQYELTSPVYITWNNIFH